jgi:CRP/FNR family cyclic AMP-dependent transcriptional regulator
VADAPGQRRTFLDSLTEEDRGALLQAGRPRRWERQELLVRAGDRADSAIVLLAGLVKIHRMGRDGSEAVLGISGPGELLGEIAAVGRATRSADATALEPAEGVAVSVSELRAFLASRPQAALALLDLALGRLHAADARRLEFATSESLARVTSRLLELAERFGSPATGGTIDVALPITQEELASWSASSRESTARALRTLRQLGLIETRRRRLLVRDPERLRAYAPRI